MLYFYCCEVSDNEKTIRIDGTVKLTKRLESSEEFEDVQEELKEGLRKYTGMYDNTSYVFIAFNPL